MNTITKEQAKDLRNAFDCWQQDYDPVEDKEQYDMFGLGIVAMDAPLASLEAEPVADERAAFEAFMEGRFKDSIDRRRVKNGDQRYFAWDMIVAWIVWQGRAAMLQGAEPVTTAYKLPFEQWLSQQTGTIDVECGCVMTEVFFHWLRVAYEAGNSPVIGEGRIDEAI